MRRILAVIINSVPELRNFEVCDEDWKAAYKVFCFLELTDSITENQPGSLYLTLSYTCLVYNILSEECQVAITSNHAVLKPVAELIHAKLLEYKHKIDSKISNLARMLDQRFGKNIISDLNFLRDQVVHVLGSAKKDR